jgi:hypothetical protein
MTLAAQIVDIHRIKFYLLESITMTSFSTITTGSAKATATITTTTVAAATKTQYLILFRVNSTTTKRHTGRLRSFTEGI